MDSFFSKGKSFHLYCLLSLAGEFCETMKPSKLAIMLILPRSFFYYGIWLTDNTQKKKISLIVKKQDRLTQTSEVMLYT